MKQNIEEAILAYANTSETTYAVMIEGRWGSGKTHFWKTVIAPQLGLDRTAYVSLYGIQSTQEIDNALFLSIARTIAPSEKFRFFRWLLSTPLFLWFRSTRFYRWLVSTRLFRWLRSNRLFRWLLSEDDNLVQIISEQQISVDGVRIGGIGIAVNMILESWKSSLVKKEKKTRVICFDDLERSENIRACIAYINKLVEHENVKCVVIGNFDADQFNKPKEQNNADNNLTHSEKTIRFRYKLLLTPTSILDIACKKRKNSSLLIPDRVRRLVQENRARYEDILDKSRCTNIRIFLRALDYFKNVYQRNKRLFNEFDYNAALYFSSILSLLVFVEYYASNDELHITLDNSPDAILTLITTKKYELAKQRDDNFELEERREISTIKEFLIENSFQLHGDRSLATGLQSLVRDGYYDDTNFSKEFDHWKRPSDLDTYNDTFKYWYLDDRQAEAVFDRVYQQVFVDRSVTNPARLLLFAHRLTNDIARGVIDKNIPTELEKLQSLIDELYRTKQMDVVERLDMNPFGDRFIYCKDLYENTICLNDKYQEERNRQDLTRFWTLLKEMPERAEELFEYHQNEPIFNQYSNPFEVVEALEQLTNGQLFEFTRSMGSRVSDGNVPQSILDIEKPGAYEVAEQINEKYNAKSGVRAGHFKQIQYILRSGRSRRSAEEVLS